MNKNIDYIPLDNIEQNASTEDEILEIQESNDQELLIPKNNVAQIDVEESNENDEENENPIGVVVENNNNIEASTSETIRNPFLPSSSTNNSTSETISGKLKKSILSEFRFFKKKPKSSKPFVINSHDGVFSNLNEKPEIRSDALPTYTEVTGEAEFDPFYGYEVTYCRIGEFYGEMLINSIPAGTWAGMVLSAFFSFIFDFIGFIMTFFLSTSHGTRKGALIGVALTIFRYGLLIITDSDNPMDGSPADEEFEYNGINGIVDQWWYGKWVGFAMMGLSIFIIYYSISRFKRILKVKEFADNHPDRVPEINL
ncbi:hypothetical protein BCR36DRAFT_317502 [Piromyces finnis]|uniref:Uncharacterized protein n=1 Tax=Piromyces finnis TaxID=1754191 RepID=A0A1Y1VN71_9FUNG|nr:hypothetical protein BCR36DRAFT_317502 [Piromyces finnis]|eukprot:ORX59354.1 hypothetical protein BCR36DRAFT_317502 [Piromyces finnis]